MLLFKVGFRETLTSFICADMEKMNRAMQAYLKHLTKKIEADVKDKKTPVSSLGQIMQSYGDDIRTNPELSKRLTSTCHLPIIPNGILQRQILTVSVFASACLGFGQTNLRIGSFQERFATDAKQTWQASVERSTAQLKDYQVCNEIPIYWRITC